LLCAAAPYLRLSVAGWTLYPLHGALAVAVGVGVLRDGPADGGVRIPLKPLLALFVYVLGVTLLREQWRLAALVGGALIAHTLWGWGAYRLGRSRTGAGGLTDALVLWPALSLLVGLALYGVGALWSPACAAVNCPPDRAWPPNLQGGWNSPAQWLVVVTFLLPVFVPLLDGVFRQRRALRAQIPLGGLGLVLLASLLAGAELWIVLPLAVAGSGLYPILGFDPAGRRLLMGSGLALAFAAVVVYGTSPAYLARLADAGTTHPAARVTLAQAPELPLEDATVVPLTLHVLNTGFEPLGRVDEPVRVGLRVLATPARGETRVLEQPAHPLPHAPAPGEAAEITLGVQLPPWLERGYLTWRVERPDGTLVPLTSDSAPGLAVTNNTWRPLRDTLHNRLTPLAARARAWAALPTLPGTPVYTADGWERAVGSVLDALVFSPLWGLPPRVAAGDGPLVPHRSMWVQLFHHFGVLGLLLAAWVVVSTGRHALLLAHGAAADARPGWQIVPLMLLILLAIGVFSGAPASYHATWGLFLLYGYAEGRVEALGLTRRAPRRTPARTPRRARPRTPRRMRRTWRR